MILVISIIAGLAWGALAAFLNKTIMQKAVAKNTQAAISKMSAARMAIDVVCLGAVFFCRKIPYINFTAAIIAAATALSMLTIVFTFKIAGSKDETGKDETK